MSRTISFLFLFCFACAPQGASDLKPFQWMIGYWTRINSKPGELGIEVWEKISDLEMVGQGINLTGADTTFVENIRLIIKDNSIFYVVSTKGNDEAVMFQLTSQSKDGTSLVFENPKHDFPTKITYDFVEGKMKAVVSGQGEAIEFLFEKK